MQIFEFYVSAKIGMMCITQGCSCLFLHHPVNTGDYFGAKEDIVRSVEGKCHICKNNKQKQFSFGYFHFPPL